MCPKIVITNMASWLQTCLMCCKLLNLSVVFQCRVLNRVAWN